MPDIFETLAYWRERLTGTRETTTGETLEEGVDALLRWHARSIVAEQMVVLEMAHLMLRHKISTGDLASYLRSSGIREKKPLGRLAAVSGLHEWVRHTWQCFLPLLRCGAYRPFLRVNVIREMLALQNAPGCAPGTFDFGDAADLFYFDATPPYAAAKSLRDVRYMLRRHPEALPKLLEAIGLARRESAPDFANLEEADCLAEALSRPEDHEQEQPDTTPAATEGG